MKIWFGTTTAKIADYKDYYFSIRNYLRQSGHVILFDWLDDAWENRLKNPGKKRNVDEIYKQVIEAIDNCQASIIEYTVPNFSSSHQLHYSLMKRKPTLVMRLHKDNVFPDSYIEAVKSPYLTVKQYSLINYKEILDEFLGYNSLEDGLARYNIMLDKKQKYYLDWASIEYQKTRSEIIRASLEKLMSQDKVYKKKFKIPT